MHYETNEKKNSDGQETREWRECDKKEKNDEKTKRSAAKKQKKLRTFFFFYAKLASTL